jgi:hypothetical protein
MSSTGTVGTACWLRRRATPRSKTPGCALDSTALATVNQVPTATAAEIELVFRPQGAALLPQASGVAAALGRLAIIIAAALADGG